MIRSSIRSVFIVNRDGLVGALIMVALAVALLTATGTWLQAGWTADAPGSGLALLSALASSFAGTTLIIVVFIIASTFSTALRHRRREFALLRAIGATATQVRSQITAEVLVVIAAGGPLGAVLGLLLAPLLTPLLVSSGVVPADFVLPFAPLAIVVTWALLLPTALVAGRLAARESAKLSPTAAVRQSDVEPAALSRGRLITAAVIAITGLTTALTPLFLPGILGAATGTSSVLLLTIAAALAGPAAIGWFASWSARTASGSQAAVTLAMMNARGFSRRNTAAILPLALILCLGVAQAGVGAASSETAAIQLENAVSADLVVAAGAGSAAEAEAIAALPGVEATAQMSAIPASVRVEDSDEEVPIFGALTWEPASIRTLTPADSGLLDPGVIAGTLDDLGAEGTIAVSRDAIVFSGKGIGDDIGLRLDGEADATARIVAIYENGLGIGDYLISAGASEAPDATVLVRTEAGSADEVQRALEDTGATVTDAHGVAESARTTTASEQSPSNTLLFALLAFIAVAALQTLATITSGRRAEFDLLHRTGTTRRQIVAMVTVESVFVFVAALVLGFAVALPALLGVGVGLTGNPFAAFDPIVFGSLAAVVIVLPSLTMFVAGWRTTAPRSGRIRVT